MSDILVVKRIWSRKVSRFYNVKVWADGNILMTQFCMLWCEFVRVGSCDVREGWNAIEVILRLF